MSTTNSPASTPYAPSWLSCARRWSAVFFFAPPVGSVLAATPRVFLCPFPTGSPMTPASWGVRRMSFGYFCVVQTLAIFRRASSCHWLYPRRIRRVNPVFLFVYCLEYHSSSPRLYTLHSTPYTLHPTLPLGRFALAIPIARFSPLSQDSLRVPTIISATMFIATNR